MKTPRFPEEILDIIVGLVATSSPDPSKTLAALALASRSMNRISTPCLYFKITVSGRKSLTRLLPLAYTLFKYPEYAAMVKVFVLEGRYRTNSSLFGEEHRSYGFSGFIGYSDDDVEPSGSSYTFDGDDTDDKYPFPLDHDSSDSDDEESDDEDGKDDDREEESDDADADDGYVHRPPRHETWPSLTAVTRKEQPVHKTKIPKTCSSRSWPKNPDVADLCRSALKRAGYHCGLDIDSYVTCMEEGNESMILSALLPSLPNLRRLQRVFGSKRDCFEGDDWLDLMHDLVLRQHPFNKNILPFQNLTDLVIDRIEEERPKYVHPRMLALLSGFPNLRNIYANKIGWGKQTYTMNDLNDHNIPYVQPVSSPLDHVELRNSRLENEFLALFLCGPKKLRTFIYELRDGTNFDGAGLMQGIFTALEPQQHNIEELSLIVTTTYPWRFSSQLHRLSLDLGPITWKTLSLSGFSRLRRLRICPLYLLGDHLIHSSESEFMMAQELWRPAMLCASLPRSLEFLQLTDSEYVLGKMYLREGIQEILHGKDRYLPRLRRVILEGRFHDKDGSWLIDPCEGTLDVLGELKEVGKSTGVVVVVLNNPQLGAGSGLGANEWEADQDVERVGQPSLLDWVMAS
jgi:hypothetical protein